MTEDAEPAEEGLANARPWPHDDDYPVASVLAALEWNGRHPLTFLARAMRVSHAASGDGRIVLGTPLFVAHSVPD